MIIPWPPAGLVLSQLDSRRQAIAVFLYENETLEQSKQNGDIFIQIRPLSLKLGAHTFF